MPGALSPPQVVTIKNVSGCCQCPLGAKVAQLRTTDVANVDINVERSIGVDDANGEHENVAEDDMDINIHRCR